MEIKYNKRKNVILFLKIENDKLTLQLVLKKPSSISENKEVMPVYKTIEDDEKKQ